MHLLLPTGFGGYVTFSVTAVTSGMAPLSVLASGNSTLLDQCIFPGTGPDTPRYIGTLVGCFARSPCGHFDATYQHWCFSTSKLDDSS